MKTGQTILIVACSPPILIGEGETAPSTWSGEMDEVQADQLKKRLEDAQKILQGLIDKGAIAMGVVVPPEQQLTESTSELIDHKMKELN